MNMADYIKFIWHFGILDTCVKTLGVKCHMILFQGMLGIGTHSNSTLADGNCLYNACSIALTGNENLSSYLRCLTSIELFENAPYYANHPLIKSQYEQGAFTSLNNAFGMCLSDTALSVFEECDHVAAVVEEAKNNAQNYEFSSMMCMFALATVIGCVIQSYYPVTDDSTAKENWDSLAKMFNCSIYPRQFFHDGLIDHVHIFRCAAIPLRYMQDRQIPQRKNHFVALCQPTVGIEVGEHYFVPRLHTLLHLVKTTHSPDQTTSTKIPKPSSTTSTKQKQVVGGTKRKQLSLDTLLPKKRVKEAQQPSSSLGDKIPSTNNSTVTTQKSTNKEKPTTSATSSINGPEKTCYSKDIYNYINRVSTMSDVEKKDLLCNVWKPESNYSFPPETKCGRRFQHGWLTRFSWLVYSSAVNGGFCINCFLFGGESTHNASKLQRLMTTPLLPSASTTQKLSQHGEKSKVHETATVRATEFKRLMERKSVPIDVQLNKARQELIEKNRRRLRTIVDAIITCGRQNIALRGHRDDAQYYLDEEETTNPGNFIEIVKYGARCGDIMDELFKDCPSNQTYRSKTIQNEIIEICGEMITEIIVTEIKVAKFFSVLADEATDSSNVEQMAVVLRYVDSKLKIREEFMGFIPCKEGLTGEALSKEITNFVRSIGLRMEECRGQGYDGAGNMAGKLSGVGARIQRIHDKAIYVHCGAHVLNLAVASSCHIALVRDMMDNVRAVSDFFNNSPKRVLVLKEKIKEKVPTTRQQKLFNVCRTRWVARINGLSIFRNCYTAILAALEAISKDKTTDRDGRYKASGMKTAIEKFKFVVCLVLADRCLRCTKPLTLQLQSATLDAGKAREKVALLYLTIHELRSEIEETHATFYEMAVSLAKEAKVLPEKERTVERQVHRENVPADSTSEYFKRSVTIPFLDQLSGQLQSRFSEGNLDVLDAMYAMPNKVVSEPDWKEKFSRFLGKYQDDLPEPDFLECELRMWRLLCTNIKDPLPTSLEELFPYVDELSFPNIRTAMKIFGTIPVTTCSCERSISTLRRLKTFMRSTMGGKRLTALALLNVHREIKLDLEKVIDRFALKHPRRMLLVDLLNSDATD